MRQDMNDNNTQIGIMGTSVLRQLDEPHLDFLHSRAYSGGFDLRHYGVQRIWQFDLRTFGSYVEGSTEAIRRTQVSTGHLFQRPDASWVELNPARTSLAGHGGSMKIAKTAGTFRGSFKVKWKSPGLELNDIGFMQNTDNITQSIWLGYRRTKPVGIMRNFYINAFQWNAWNFGGIREYSGGHLSLNSQFSNFMSAEIGTDVNGGQLSSTALRGGPRLLIPDNWKHWIWFGTDSRKNFYTDIFVNMQHSGNELNRGNYMDWDLEWNISDHINVSVSTDRSINRDVFQYVSTITETADPRYILARLNYESAGLQMGLNINITPDFSIEYRGRFFFSAGAYDDFKRITDAGNPDYEKRFELLTSRLTPDGDVYYCDEDLDGISDYRFDNPDFVFNSFRSNLVLRWEYLPGSVLFLVWSQDNHMNSDFNHLTLPGNIRDLRNEIPYNIFLLKVSCRMGR
ncbi:MAG: DUF5916 domain-containing protein [Candidatus Marinimicrobia bacterium]|nr:DUF5916 domain-containing protein [Candidatus Neomarinimicrobiota bacterium]